MTLRQAPLAAPAEGEVLVRVAACGLNFADTLMLEGTYQERPQLPIVPGMEVAGTIVATGSPDDTARIGTRVAAFVGQGGLSAFVRLQLSACHPLPESVGMVEASAFQIVYGTIHLALSHRARMGAGERLVVTGAAGGTGLAAVALGRLMGAEVVAIARGEAKLDLARRAGATHAIDAGASDLADRIKALGGGDVLVDTVGEPLWGHLLRAANPEARLFPIGFAGGSVPQIKANHLLVKNLTIVGFYWGGYLRFAPDLLHRSLRQILSWIASGDLSVHVGSTIPFAEADTALDRIRRREALGKVVVTFGA